MGPLLPKDEQFFVVLETDNANVVVAEQAPDQSLVWNENPEDLDARRSLAKVLRVADCHGKDVTVGALRNSTVCENEHCSTALQWRRRYADQLYQRAAGQETCAVEPQRYRAELLRSITVLGKDREDLHRELQSDLKAR